MNLLAGTNLLFLICLVVYVAIRKHFMTRTQFAETEVNAVDRWERLLLFMMAMTVIILPVVYLLTPIFRFSDYSLPVWNRSLGLLVIVGSLFLFWRAHADLGANWSPSLEVRKTTS